MFGTLSPLVRWAAGALLVIVTILGIYYKGRLDEREIFNRYKAEVKAAAMAQEEKVEAAKDAISDILNSSEIEFLKQKFQEDGKEGFKDEVVAAVKDVGDEPNAADLIGGVKVMLDAYDEGRIDRLFVVSNEFVNTMTQSPSVEQLLPLAANDDTRLKHHWDYIYEPDAKELLDGLLIRYIESQVYQGVVENKACEQAARMLAMKNATENAGEMIDELQLLYNKARQAAITQELSEIVSGAAAV